MERSEKDTEIELVKGRQEKKKKETEEAVKNEQAGGNESGQTGDRETEDKIRTVAIVREITERERDRRRMERRKRGRVEGWRRSRQGGRHGG